ncbi:DUF429 domain-containing protein [Thalassospiraceae bacterium LMO-SO8]|nr:DUF429 domain-containing protein [Alphaproteobacteria bacterium LMO-S08]WND77370.1 DUF429 domain-containing protein [Thalassospiraceae bacterium LMO-SO8]
MTAILAIDAAWTTTNPSGVAVVSHHGGSWRCRGISPSYEAFYRLPDGEAPDWSAKHVDRGPEPDRLISVAQRMVGNVAIEVVTVDMPLSLAPIIGRRSADDAISRAFGGKGCSAHTPSTSRPGKIAETIRDGLSEYRLATAGTSAGTRPALVEVYPHPALLALTGSDYRLPYKVARSGRYWRGASVTEKKARLLEQYRLILRALSKRIEGIHVPLPEPDNVTLTGLKTYEDGIDALVCAWAGIEYLEGRAAAYGDADAAVWVPTDE